MNDLKQNLVTILNQKSKIFIQTTQRAKVKDIVIDHKTIKYLSAVIKL